MLAQFEESIKASVSGELAFMIGQLYEMAHVMESLEKNQTDRTAADRAVAHVKRNILRQCWNIRHEEKIYRGVYGLTLLDLLGRDATWDCTQLIRKISDWDCVQDITTKQVVALFNALTTAAIRKRKRR